MEGERDRAGPRPPLRSSVLVESGTVERSLRPQGTRAPHGAAAAAALVAVNIRAGPGGVSGGEGESAAGR